MADPIVKLTVEDSSFNAKIQAAAKSFADFGKNVANAGVDAFGKFARGVETASGAFKSFNAVLKANALVFVATTAIQAGSAIADLVSDWITGASEAEEAQRKLNEEIEETIKKVKALDEESNFNVRIAKAMGKSTTDILQMKLDNAIQRRNELQNAALNPSVQAGTEAWNSLNKEIEIYDKQIKKIKQDIEVNKTAQEYHTGEYSVRGGGGGGRRGGSRTDPSESVLNNFQKSMAKAGLGADSLKGSDDRYFISPQALFGESDDWEKYKDTITGSIESIGEEMNNLTQWTDNFDPYAEKMREIAEAAKQQQMAFNLAGQAATSLSSALSSMEDPAAKAAGTVIQAIADITLGFAMASTQAGALGPFGWIAWLAAGAAALATTISTVHSLTGYSEGGIVGGSSFSGDNVFAGNAMVNSGELILNRAQQNSLAASLSENSALANLNLTATLKGEDLRMSINRNGRRTGKGEMTTTKFR
jgi:hypothetical protein